MYFLAPNAVCRFFGSRSLKVAMSYHLVARTLSCKGDFRTALQNEKEAYAIYREQVREAETTTCQIQSLPWVLQTFIRFLSEN